MHLPRAVTIWFWHPKRHVGDGAGPGSVVRAALCPSGAGQRVNHRETAALQHVSHAPRPPHQPPARPNSSGLRCSGQQYVRGQRWFGMAARYGVIDAAARLLLARRRLDRRRGRGIWRRRRRESRCSRGWVWHAYGSRRAIAWAALPLLVAGRRPTPTVALRLKTLERGFDVVVAGEAEETIVHLVDAVVRETTVVGGAGDSLSRRQRYAAKRRPVRSRSPTLDKPGVPAASRRHSYDKYWYEPVGARK